MCHLRAQYSRICPEQFFWYKQLLLLSSSYWSFSLGKVLKKIFQQRQSYEDASLSGPKWSICPLQMFFKKIIYVNFFYLLTPFVMRMRLFWVQNSPFGQMRSFSKKPVNKPCSFHSSLSTCQKSKLDIHLLMIY